MTPAERLTVIVRELKDISNELHATGTQGAKLVRPLREARVHVERVLTAVGTHPDTARRERELTDPSVHESAE